MTNELTEFDSDPYSLFIFALNSPSTKEKCVPRLNKFFEFMNLNGTICAIDLPSLNVLFIYSPVSPVSSLCDRDL